MSKSVSNPAAMPESDKIKIGLSIPSVVISAVAKIGAAIKALLEGTGDNSQDMVVTVNNYTEVDLAQKQYSTKHKRSSKMVFILVISFFMLAGCIDPKGGSALPKILKVGNTYEIGFIGRDNRQYEILELDDSGWVKTNSSLYGTEWLNVEQFATGINE